MGEEKETYWNWIQEHLQKSDLCDPVCKRLYGEMSGILEKEGSIDMLLIGQYLEKGEEDILDIIIQKKVNTTKFQEGLLATMQKILERNWMLKREVIKRKIQSGGSNEEEILLLAKEFDVLKKQKPTVKTLQKEGN
jgi:DNA primase